MSKIIVTVKALIPVIQYGNIQIEATEEIELDENNTTSLMTDIAITDLRKSVADAILPLVESEVERCASVLLKEANPDSWMRRNSTVYQWFRISNPDVEIPAMTNIAKQKASLTTVNRGAASLKEVDKPFKPIPRGLAPSWTDGHGLDESDEPSHMPGLK